MLRFLSEEWVQALDAALRADGDLGARFASSPIAIAQEVTATPRDGESAAARYVVVLDGDGGRITSDASADVTFVCDRATAVGLALGDVNAQRALTSGRLKLRGEIDRLAAASSALSGLRDVFAGLRADTEF